jgi:hypothetical protein
MKKYNYCLRSSLSIFAILFLLFLIVLILYKNSNHSYEFLTNGGGSGGSGGSYGSGEVGVVGRGFETRKCPPGFKHFLSHTYPYKGKCVLKYGTTLFPSYPECCKKSLRSLWEVSTKPPKSTYFRTRARARDRNPLFPLRLEIQGDRADILESFSGKEFELAPPIIENKSLSGNFADKEYYWCNNGLRTCQRKRVNRHQFWRNHCGPTSISGVSAPIYYSEADCMRDGNQCEGSNRRDCLSKQSCGWCIDDKGKGQCVKGTAEGPLNIGLYPYCVPQFTQYSTFEQNKKYRNKEANTWLQGYADPYIHDQVQDHV